MSSPRVSIIVPIYNAEKFLHKCIDSILMQTYQDFELILIDDGSKDASGAICDEYAGKDTRIRVFHKENGGVSSARNVGLDNTQGQYVTFVDADDWVEDDMLDSMLSCLTDDANGVVFCGVTRLTGRKTGVIHFKCDESFPSIEEYVRCYDIGYALWGVLYEKEHIDKTHLRFSEDLIMSEDCVFNMQYFATYKGNIHCIKKKLYVYNDKNPDSVCRSTISIEKCVSQIKSSIMVQDIIAEGKIAKYLNRVSKENYKASLNFLSLLTSPLLGYYAQVYARIDYPGLELCFARHFLFAYIQYRIIRRNIKHFLLGFIKSISKHDTNE